MVIANNKIKDKVILYGIYIRRNTIRYKISE